MHGTAIFALRGVRFAWLTASSTPRTQKRCIIQKQVLAAGWGDSRWFCEIVMLFGGAAPVRSFGTTSSASLCPRPQLLGYRSASALGCRAALSMFWVYFLQFQLLQQWSPVAWEISCAPCVTCTFPNDCSPLGTLGKYSSTSENL